MNRLLTHQFLPSGRASNSASRAAASLALVAMAALVAGACAGSGVAGGEGEAGPDEVEVAESEAWQTARFPSVAANGLVELYFTRPGVEPHMGEDPEVDDAIANLMDIAQDRIDLCLFDFNRPVLVDAALAALARGVTVRFAGDGDELVGGEAGYVALADAGVELALRKPNDRIMHNKFVIVDDRWLVTGSMNFSENGVMRNNNHAVVLDSPEASARYRAEFEQMFDGKLFGTKKLVNLEHGPVNLGERPVEIYFSPKDDVDEQVLNALATADERVFFMIFSFTHKGISAMFQQLHTEGVEVVGIFDESQARGRYSVDETLAQAGVPVFIDGNHNSSGFAGGKMHHKVMLIDPGGSDPIAIIGSYNWSAAATLYNDENIIVLRGADLVTPFLEEFCEQLDVAVPHPELATAAPDPCANLLAPIRINEVLPNPDGADGPSEFVELVNTGSATVNLTGWTLGDLLNPARHTFAPVQLRAGAAMVVWSGASVDDPDRVVASSGALSLNNNAETVQLHDLAGTLIDRVQYTNAASGIGFNRTVDGTDNDALVAHDTLAPDGAGFSPGALVDGTPWAAAEAPPTAVINELLPNPDGTDKGSEFVEIVNVTDGPLDLSGFTLSDALATRHVFPEGSILQPGSVVVVYDSGDHLEPWAQVATSGALSLNNAGDRVVLAGLDGKPVSALIWTSSKNGISINRATDQDPEADWLPHDEVSSQGLLHSAGAQPDGVPFPYWQVPPVVFINEALPNPEGIDGGSEYVEIINATGTPVDISGWSLSDLSTDRHVFPNLTVLKTGAVVLLYDSGDHGEALVSSSGSLSLNNSAETLVLADATGAPLDTLSWTSAPAGIALNRSPDGEPGAPLLPHTEVAPDGAATSPGTRADGTPW